MEEKLIELYFCENCDYPYSDYDCLNIVNQEKVCPICGLLDWELRKITQEQYDEILAQEAISGLAKFIL